MVRGRAFNRRLRRLIVRSLDSRFDNQRASEPPNAVPEFAAKILITYYFILAIYLILQAIPLSGEWQLVLGYPTELLLLAGVYVYLRRFADWGKSVSEEIWGELTTENGEPPQTHPRWKTMEELLFCRANWEPRKKQIMNRISSGFVWLSFCIILQFVILGAHIWLLESGQFDGLASQYQSARAGGTGILAVFSPLLAFFYFALGSIGGGVESALVLLYLVGLPAILAAPALKNLLEAGEMCYVVLSSKLEALSVKIIGIDRFSARTGVHMIGLILTAVVHLLISGL